MITFTIFSIYDAAFQERIDKANRKALKNGLPQLHHTIDRDRNGDGRLVSTIRLDDDLPHFQGWHMIAALDFIEDVTLVRTLRWRYLPNEFQAADPKRCDHCNIRHHRITAYVIGNSDLDQIKQIGATCLIDFLGKDAASLINMSWLEDFIHDCDNGGDVDEIGSTGYVSGLDLVHYLSLVQLSIKVYGWISRFKSAQLGSQATADHALMMSWSGTERKAVIEKAALSPAKGIDIADAIAWAAKQSGNDYFHNISKLAQLDIVPRKYAGYAASILATYAGRLQREEERKLAQKDAKPAPTGRLQVSGTIVAVVPKDSMYGTVLKMTVQCDGWKLWATLPKAIHDAAVGDVIELTITVKPSPDDESFAFGSRPTKASIK